MAEDQAKEDLNAIVQAIGLGIVGDFRELRQSMYGISAEMDESNRLLGDVNQNLEVTNRSLDQLEKDVYKQIDARQFRQLENQLEQKNKRSVRRQDEIMRSVLNAVNDIKRQAGGVRMKIDAEGNVTEEELPGGGDTGGRTSGGSLLGGAITAAVGAAAVAGAVYMMSSSSAADSSGAQQPSNPPPSPPIAPTLPTNNSPGPAMSAPMAAPPPRQPAVPSTPSLATPTPPRSNFNISGASQAVSAIATTAKSKALAKVQTKAANWFSRNGGRIVETIGPQYIQAFGKMIGGRFSFNRFMSDDSWTELGLAYLNGDRLPDTGRGDPNLTYVAQVVVNLAIQAYLISREIYSAENAAEITSNLVPNFDEVEDADRKQVVKNVGATLENYVNFLIDRSKPTAATTAANASATTTPPPSSIGGGLEPPQAAGGGGMGGGGGGGDTGGGSSGSPPAADSGGGGGGGGGNEFIAPPPVDSVGGGGGGDTQTTSPAESPAATGGASTESSDAEVSPSDTTANFGVSSDQTSGVPGGSLEELKAEIASGEGDYGAYNRGVAGDTPRSKQTVDIQNLTVAEVMQLQRQRKLFAVGKYQFIPNTLSEAVSATGVDPSQKFDAATQEQLFPYLISPAKRPRLASYLSGRSDDEDAALNDLAHEFASIPMSNGRGAYDGDRAGNAAAGGVRRAQKIKGILRGIRQSSASNSTNKDEAPALASGGVVTPLPSDKASSNMSAALAPINETMAIQQASGAGSDEDSVSSSMTAIDARSKKVASNPHDDAKNKISYYSYLMQHHFGNLKDDMRQAHEEVTSDDYHFGRAMDPLV